MAGGEKAARERRLAEALRANLKRRRAQTGARTAADGAGRDDGAASHEPAGVDGRAPDGASGVDSADVEGGGPGAPLAESGRLR